MTKAEVLEGFAFPNPGEADMLQRWLDDATLGTRRRKALVIVGPKCSGKTTLLYRIAEYKGEAPCFYDGRSGIVPAKLSHGDTLRRYRELELCKVILVNDLLVRSHESMIEVLLFASGFKKRIRSKEGKVLEFNIAAPCAVAVSADCTERAERWASVSLSVFDDERMPLLWIHPTIAGAHHGRKEKVATDEKQQEATTGSLAYRMNYGLYVEKFPHGNKDCDAKPCDDGYAIVSKRDPSNINWVSKTTFDLIQAGHSMITGGKEAV